MLRLDESEVDESDPLPLARGLRTTVTSQDPLHICQLRSAVQAEGTELRPAGAERTAPWGARPRSKHPVPAEPVQRSTGIPRMQVYVHFLQTVLRGKHH